MASKIVFIIRYYELIERKIMRWTGLEAHLQERENKYITFLRNLLKKKLIKDLRISDNYLKWQ
jgi:hypothetical protein